MPALLQVEGISKSFGGLRAVDQCSFVVERGSITALIGPNGAGKTTAFNMISGILVPDEGTIRFRGENITGLRPHRITRKGIGRTFQITRELGDLTVLENMVVGSARGSIRGLLGGRMLAREERQAMELLDFVGISHLAHAKAKTLSYGQRKLLEFASVLMGEPELILLDEPAGGVNPALLERIVDRIKALNESGITFLIVEHNMDLVMSLSDEVVVMAHGEVLVQGPPEVVQTDDRVLGAYLGKA